MTLVPPVFVTVSDSDELLPTVTLPKLKLVGFVPSVPGVTPVPVNPIVSVGFDPFEVIVTLPLALPAAVGVNFTLNVALWPEVSVTGAVIPLRLKPVPLMLTCEIVTLAPPVFVTVSDSELLLPTVTLPKLRLAGFAPRVPGATPVPDKPIASVGFEAFEVSVTAPLALPAAVGVNTTLKLVLCPAARVIGTVTPVRVNPLPLTPTCEIVTLVPPVLVIVSDRDWLLPTVTLPKLKLVGLAPSVPGVTPVPDSVIVSVGFDALEIMVTLPLALPATVGVNVTLKVALCPAARVTGAVMPLSANPVPLMLT